MSGTGCVEEEFGGETRSFRVDLGGLRKIQVACGDTGPGVIAERLARCAHTLRSMPKAKIGDLALAGLGDWRIDDIREPIMVGLIGGGMSPNDAGRLVRENIDERGFRGLIENAGLALVLILAGVDTPRDDVVGEPMAGAPKATRSRADRSPSPKSTAPGRRAGSRREKSTG